MLCKLRRFYVGLVLVGSSVCVADQEPLICSSDFWAGWGSPEIRYYDGSLLSVDSADDQLPALPAEAKPETAKVYLTPGWAFAIGENSRGLRRIWRIPRRLNSEYLHWTDWGGMPPGFEFGPFLFAHGAVWLIGSQPDRPSLYRAPVHVRSAMWSGVGPLPADRVSDPKLLDDGSLAVEVLDETGGTAWRVGDFLGGGAGVSWSTNDLTSPAPPSFSDQTSFRGEVDLGGYGLILALSWQAKGLDSRKPTIRYRTSPAENAPYGPWSTKISGSPSKIGQRGRYFEYQIQFPSDSQMEVGDIRVHYIFPEGGRAGPTISTPGGREKKDSPHRLDAALTSPPSEDVSDSNCDEKNQEETGKQISNTDPSDSPNHPISVSEPKRQDTSSSSDADLSDDAPANPSTTNASQPSVDEGKDPSPSEVSSPDDSPAMESMGSEKMEPDPARSTTATRGGEESRDGNGQGRTSSDEGTPKDSNPHLTSPSPWGRDLASPPEDRGEIERGVDMMPGDSRVNPHLTSPNPWGRDSSSPPEDRGEIERGVDMMPGDSRVNPHLTSPNPWGSDSASLLGRQRSTGAPGPEGTVTRQQEHGTFPWLSVGSAGVSGWLALTALLLFLMRRSKKKREEETLIPAAEPYELPTEGFLKKKLAIILDPGFHFRSPDHEEEPPETQLPLDECSVAAPQCSVKEEPPTCLEAAVAVSGEAAPTGMTAAAFQSKHALYSLDERGQIYRSDIVNRRIQTARRVGAAPIHCENPRLAVSREAIFFLATAASPGASRLLAAPLNARGTVGRWRVLSFPRRINAPGLFWIEKDRLFIIGTDNDRAAIYAAKIEGGHTLGDWEHVLDLPSGQCPESAATLGERCFIAARSVQTGLLELLAFSMERSLLVSRLGCLDDVRGEASLVVGPDQVILLDGGDWPGRAQIRAAKLDSDGYLSSWVNQPAGYHGVLSSLSGVVVGDAVLIAGRNSSGHRDDAPISIYTSNLPLAS